MGFFHEGIAYELIPYVRALAWWHAVPQSPPSRLKNAAPEPPNRVSRMKAVTDAGGIADLPHYPQPLAYLIEYLFDAGPTSPSGTGSVALTWADLGAWERGTGVSLPPWTSRLLRRLSSEYLGESLRATAHDAPPPWDRVGDRERVARHVRRILRG
jgi:hypothetical protein